MALYKIFFKPSAIKELAGVSASMQPKINERIAGLKDNPRPKDHIKLTGNDGYRIRIGDHRAIYLIDDKEKFVRILKIGHRREVYRE